MTLKITSGWRFLVLCALRAAVMVSPIVISEQPNRRLGFRGEQMCLLRRWLKLPMVVNSVAWGREEFTVHEAPVLVGRQT